MSICIRYAISRDNAEEILNDTFYKVFKNIDKYNVDQNFKPWLNKITVNTAIDYLRRRKSMLSWVELVPDKIQYLFSTTNIDEDKEESKMLMIINDLPPQYRLVFNLYVFEEYTHKEISQKLGIAVGTSKSNYARAKALVEKKLRSNPEYFALIEQKI